MKIGRKEIDNKNIGQRMRHEREKLGLSREELAEIIGLSDYYVGQLERGERQMSLPVFVKVAGCLHVSLDYLVWGKNSLHNDKYIHDESTAYEIFQNDKDSEEIKELIGKLSIKEVELIKKVIKTIIPYLGKD